MTFDCEVFIKDDGTMKKAKGKGKGKGKGKDEKEKKENFVDDEEEMGGDEEGDEEEGDSPDVKRVVTEFDGLELD